MYLEITTYCNMKCDHCCGNYPHRGGNMSLETAKRAMEIAQNNRDTIAIGGGEPTMHPNFWAIVGMAIGYSEEIPWMATNGKNTEIAMALLRAANNGAISVALSLDYYHETIDSRVEEAFEKIASKRNNNYGHVERSCAEIRNVNEKVMHFGRAITTGVYDIQTKNDCCCPDLWIGWNGNIYGCGCKKAKFGTVFEPKMDEYQAWREKHENHI